MTKYAVKQLSELSGVSVRTLHHYDQIGLLKPESRTEKGYRYYGRNELLKLQQILFYKEMDMSLKEIREIVNNPDFDLKAALESHKEKLRKRSLRMRKLLVTIEKTIIELKNNNQMMTDKEIYAGFKPEQIEPIRKEVKERWGEEELLAVEERIKAAGKDGWDDIQKKGEEINKLLADLMDLPPAHVNVQKAIVMHHKQLNFFYEVNKERYIGLAEMYVEDERFKSFYDKYRVGMAGFIKEAIEIYCNNDLNVVEDL